VHEEDREAFAGLVGASWWRRAAGDRPLAQSPPRRQTIWCEWYHSALDDAGQIVSILSFVQDVSSRIQAEERLQYLAPAMR
jgi:PAS domain S-box-containing protein